MISKKRIFAWIACLLLLALLAFSERLTVYETWFCGRCLLEVQSVKKSTFGITYSSEKTYRGGVGETWSESSDSGLYDEIMGHPCAHDFILRSFARSKHGGVGCGAGFERDFEVRNAMLRCLFGTYRRVPDKALARESLARIDQFLPIHELTGSRKGYSLLSVILFDEEALRDEPVSIFLRGFELVNSREEWRQLLERCQASPEALAVLQDRDLLIKRLDHRDAFSTPSGLESNSPQ